MLYRHIIYNILNIIIIVQGREADLGERLAMHLVSVEDLGEG